MDLTNSDQNKDLITSDASAQKKEIENICADLGIDIDETLSLSQTPMSKLTSTNAQMTPNYDGFRNFDKNRDRGASRRYSAMVNGDIGLDDREFLITDEQRWKKIKWYIVTSLLNITLITYMTVIICITFDQSTDECVAELKKWIWVYLGVEVAHALRKITYAIAWKRTKDPTIFTTYFDFFFFVFVITFQIAWFCYGTYIVFGNTYTNCITNDPDEQILFYTTASLQIYGFCFMTAYFCIILFSLTFYFAFKKISSEGEETEKRMQAKKPYFQQFTYQSQIQRMNTKSSANSKGNKKRSKDDLLDKNGKQNINASNQIENPNERTTKLSLISEKELDESDNDINA